MKGYSESRPSGQGWIGDIPAHWVTRRLGGQFAQRTEVVSDADHPPLSVTNVGIVPQRDDVAKTVHNDHRKRVRVGDFVINSRSDRKGAAGISLLDGSVSTISIVLEPKGTGLHHRYAHHLLRSHAFQEEFYRWGNGIVADLWSTRYVAMKSISLPIPPVEEQVLIAEHLDRATVQVDELIAEQEALLVALSERRQAEIAEALDVVAFPTSRQRLKHVVTSVRQGWSPQCDAVPGDGVSEWAVLKTGCVNRGIFRPTENKLLPKQIDPRPETVVRADEVLICRASTRELVGSAAVVQGDFPRLMLSDKLYALRVDRQLAEPEFVALRLGTRAVRDLIELAASGASHSMQNISQRDIVNLPMDLPPVDDQRDALRTLRQRTDKIDDLMRECRDLIALLKERRSALITAAVTGKIDVRGQ